MYIYVFMVRKPGADEDTTIEFQAPDSATAIMLIAAEWPGIHIIEYMGSYLPGMGGTA